jgi:hypothetical protein
MVKAGFGQLFFVTPTSLIPVTPLASSVNNNGNDRDDHAASCF